MAQDSSTRSLTLWNYPIVESPTKHQPMSLDIWNKPNAVFPTKHQPKGLTFWELAILLRKRRFSIFI